jgi:hypothetical protein
METALIIFFVALPVIAIIMGIVDIGKNRYIEKRNKPYFYFLVVLFPFLGTLIYYGIKLFVLNKPQNRNKFVKT